MPGTPTSDDELERRDAAGEEGVVTWWSAAALDRSARRWRRGAVALGLLAAFWTLGFFAEDRSDDTMLGFVILEVFTLAPLLYCLYRLRRLARLRRGLAPDLGVQAAGVVERRERHAAVDEAVRRIESIVDRLPDGVRDDAGQEALRVAHRTAGEWRRLLDGTAELRALRDGSTRREPTRAIKERVERSEAGAERLARSMDDLTVALVHLCEASEEDDLAAVTAELHAAEERMRLLAGAMRELQGRSAGPGPGEVRGASS